MVGQERAARVFWAIGVGPLWRATKGAIAGMSRKLFVGGLAWKTSDEMLRGAFDKFGEIVEAKVIMDRETGRSRGFGFVTFADDAAANQAIAEMNGKQLDGRAIQVNQAEERAPRSGGDRGDRGGRPGGGGGGGYGGRRR